MTTAPISLQMATILFLGIPAFVTNAIYEFDIFQSAFVLSWFCLNFVTAFIILVVDISNESNSENRERSYQIVMFILCAISFALSIQLLFSLLPDYETSPWLKVLDILTIFPHILQEITNMTIHLILIYSIVRGVNFNLLLITARIRSIFMLVCWLCYVVIVIIHFLYGRSDMFRWLRSDTFLTTFLIDRSMIYLLSGKEFNSNIHSNLVRKAQVASAFSIKSSVSTIVRLVVMIAFVLKTELLNSIGAESEELSSLRRRLHQIYTDEFSAFMPAVTGIMLISLYHDSFLKAHLDPDRFKSHDTHVIDMRLNRLAEENRENRED